MPSNLKFAGPKFVSNLTFCKTSTIEYFPNIINQLLDILYTMNLEFSTTENQADYQSNLHCADNFAFVDCGSKSITDVVFGDTRVKSEFVKGFDDRCFQSDNNERNSEQSSDSIEVGKHNIDIKHEPDIQIEEIEVKPEFNGDDCTNDSTTKSLSPLRSETKVDEENTSLQHTDVKSRERRHVCTVCEFTTATATNLKVHMRSHTGEKPYKCIMCEYASTTASNLKSHMRTHSQEKPFACTICKYAASQSRDLKVHMRTHTGDKPYQCPTCQYATVKSSLLKVHMQKHTGEKRHKCTICGYTAARSHQLKTHMRTHTGENKYKCPSCNYAAAVAYQLKEHIESTHYEGNPVCNRCQYVATTFEELKEHRTSHSRRKHKCSMCEYAGLSPYTLRVHMRKHTGERPYSCTICKYAAAKPDTLKLHMKRHTDEKEAIRSEQTSSPLSPKKIKLEEVGTVNSNEFQNI